MTRSEKNKYLHQALNLANNEFMELMDRVSALERKCHKVDELEEMVFEQKAEIEMLIALQRDSKKIFDEQMGDPIKKLDEIFKL